MECLPRREFLSLEPALLWHCHLDQLVYIPLPDESCNSIFEAALRKPPTTKVVNLRALAKYTQGFSGVDITEICQRACKYPIKENIEKDIERETRARGNPGAMEEDVPEIKAAHFEESMKFARGNPNSDADIRKYQAFSQTLMESRGLASSSVCCLCWWS